MSEAGFVELPVLQWLSGHRSATPGDNGLGWTYRGEADMAAFERPLDDPLVEKLLIAAILRINPQVKTNAQALLAIQALRISMAQPDRQATYFELSAKTRELILENTTFMDTAIALPVFKIDKDYLSKLEDLPSAADKAAALEALLTADLAEGDAGFTYQQLGDRLARLKARKDTEDKTAEARLAKLQGIADATVLRVEEPAALKLTQPGEYALFAVLRDQSTNSGTLYLADCARRMVAHLVAHQLLAPGWSQGKSGRDRVERSLLAESWNPYYAGLGFDTTAEAPAFLSLAVAELAKCDDLG